MTSSDPGGVDVALDDVVARVRELPGRFRSLFVETDGWTDWVLGERASAWRQRLLAPPPAAEQDGSRARHGWHARSWLVFDPDQYDHPMIGVLPRRYREEIVSTERDGTFTRTINGADESARSWNHGDGFRRVDGRTTMGSLYKLVGRRPALDRWRCGPRGEGPAVDVLGQRCTRVQVTPPKALWAPGRLADGDARLRHAHCDSLRRR